MFLSILALLLVAPLPALHLSGQSEGSGGKKIGDPFGFRSKEERVDALRKYGGDAGTEEAVLKALRWLAKVQNPDGSWGDRGNRPGISGLALLAFLGHGETPSSPEFGKNVGAAIKFFISGFDRTSGFFCRESDTYNHAIATFAVSEAYGMTREPGLYEVMNLAVAKIIEGQRTQGGWDYRYGNSSRRDLSVGGWNIQALTAAKHASCKNESMRKSLAKAAYDLKKHYDAASGIFLYDNETKRESLVPVGTLCLIEIEGMESAEFKGGLKFLLSNDKMEWRKDIQWPLYTWYYQTLTFFKSEKNWSKWNSQMKRILLANQMEDGHWESPGDVFGVGGMDFKVYSTCLCCLMLEVYYRYFTVSVEKEGGGSGGGGRGGHGEAGGAAKEGGGGRSDDGSENVSEDKKIKKNIRLPY